MALPKPLEIERKLGSSLADLVAERRSAGISWQGIASEIIQRTGVDITKETIRVWFADQLEVKVTVRVKLTHKIPAVAVESAWRSVDVDPGSRFDTELAMARRRAYKAWRAAQRALRVAERKCNQAPAAECFTDRDRLRLLVLQRLDELRTIEESMAAPVGGVKRSGTGSVRAVTKGRAW